MDDETGYYVGIDVVPPQTRKPYQYKYNHREWQDEFGLNVYAMDWRQYDPAIARWVVHDPVIHHSMSPYNAFDNNPVFWADPSGGNSIASAFLNIDWSNVGLNYNWDTEGYTFNGENISDGLAVTILNISLAFNITGEGGGGGEDPQGIRGVSTAFFKAGMFVSPTFFGVPVRLIPGNGTAASYFGEAINMSVGLWKEYLERGLDSGVGRLLMHEYGHYLQSQIGNTAWYYLGAAPASFISFLTNDSEGHRNHWAEIQASTLAYYYFGKPEKFHISNTMNTTYSSMEILNALYNQYLNHPDY